MNIESLLSSLNKSKKNKQDDPFIDKIRKTYHYSDNEAFEFLNLFINLVLEFKNTYPKEKEIFILRVPGRVNLIGEHLDYNGFPVLPIAIEKNVIIIFSKRKDNIIKLQNHDIRFEPREFFLSNSTEPYPMGDWGNYFKAGTLGLNLPEIETLKGFNALIYGNIPIAAGLSSSSAMVVTSALTLLKSNEIKFNKLELADKLAKAEHYVGTMGGGMDQATILFGEESKVLKIDFFPLTISSFQLPAEFSFIVANTCVKSAKTEKMKNEYNRRPLECKISTAILKKKLEKRINQNFNFIRLGDIVKDAIGMEIIMEISEMFLAQDSYSTEDIIEILGTTKNDFTKEYLTLKNGEIFPEPPDGFKLKQRFNYVINEKSRVLKSINLFENQQVEQFGQLMLQAHNEARDLYEISCAELDNMVEIAINGGALGARLTGAGFGGCCIILTKKENAKELIRYIKKEYYGTYLKNHRKDIFDKISILDDNIFICSPSDGAQLLYE